MNTNIGNKQKGEFQFTRLSSIALTVVLMLGGAHEAMAGKSSQPADMAYVPFTATVMGIDKEPSGISSDPRETSSMYDRRMSMPWSRDAFHDEGPAHWVVMDAYFIDKYEVSNKDYRNFMKATGHSAPAYWDDPRLNKPEQPVVGVNWYDATAFCEWQGKRLPTESEWEHAARGPEGYSYPWGNTFDPSKANFGQRKSATVPVDSMPEGQSYYGLHHMAGNVFEWVKDWYDPTFYKKVPHGVNPAGPPKPLWLGGTGTYVDRLTVGEKRVIRGGSWIAAENTITTTHRFWNHPSNNSYGVGLGFRCAKSAPQKIVNEVRTATIEVMKYMGQEKFEEAKKHLTKALVLDPQNEELLQLQSMMEKAN
jgi:formylglycine-generating enzyme required for sulfatase activity